VLLVRGDHLGDLLMATPAFRALRRARPRAHIEVLASPWGAPALRGNPDVDAVRTFPATWYEAARCGTLRLSDVRRTVAALRRDRFDLGVDLRGDPRMILLLALGGVARRVGLAGLGLETLLGASVPLRSDWDHRRRNLEVAALLGADPAAAPERPVFVIAPEDREAAQRRLAPVRRPRIVVAPGSNRRANTWGAERFAAAAARLAAASGGGIVLVGRKADRWATVEVRDRLGRDCLDLTGTTELGELAGVLAAADLLLVNDSGALHLAVAAGCPVVAIFGPTDPGLTFPYPASAGVALAGPTPCARPCFRRDCTETHGYEKVEPAAVATAGHEQLRGRGVL
jgi:lipopolysaccharide heptosyltransferase II